ncbi:hypothetical protein PGB90_001003 [Kerria lacca]
MSQRQFLSISARLSKLLNYIETSYSFFIQLSIGVAISKNKTNFWLIRRLILKYDLKKCNDSKCDRRDRVFVSFTRNL